MPWMHMTTLRTWQPRSIGVVGVSQAIFTDGRWNGRLLSEWVPDAVADVVRAADPFRVIVFGSVARGEDGPDSDLDLMVVLNSLDGRDRLRLMGEIRAAISVPVPIDVVVTDRASYDSRRDLVGSMEYWPSREGYVAYERTAA